MIEGHPWATDELDELRAKQRRQLRDVRDSRIEELEDLGTAVASIVPGEALMVERFLRDRAEIAADPISDLLASWEGAAAKTAAAPALRALSDMGSSVSMGSPRNLFRGDAATLESQVKLVHDPELGDPDYTNLHVWLYLVVLAELVSDDGYVDSRLFQVSDEAIFDR